MLIKVRWTFIEGEDDPLWQEQLCLYSYFHPSRDWLLYVGKADYATVRSRMRGDHKARLWHDLQRKYAIKEVRVLQGELLVSGRRTSELLSDVESLLIMTLQPFGNIQSTRSRISRPGMHVHCINHWPLTHRHFYDNG
jgi:hypothetical protein